MVEIAVTNSQFIDVYKTGECSYNLENEEIHITAKYTK